MSYLSSLFVAALLCTTTLACKDDASCDKVVDHVVSLMPAEMKGAMGDKSEMIAECEKQPAEVRECMLAAKDLAALNQCRPK